jgi:hypothetical protein
VQEYDSHRLGRSKALGQISKSLPTPSPVFVQVFILMALGMTIYVSYARGGFVAVFVGEEKTPGARSVADSAVSSKAGNRRGSREAEV